MKIIYKFSISLICSLLILPLGALLFATEHAHLHEQLNNDNLPLILRLLNLGTSPYTTINPANSLSNEVNSLYGLFTWVGVGILTFVLLLFVIIIYRFRESKNPQPKDIHANVAFEIIWNILPIIILVILAVPTLRLLFKINEVPKPTLEAFTFASEPQKQYKRVLEVTVVGHQWWWEFEYTGWRIIDPDTKEVKHIPIERVTANEPIFPIGVPVSLTMVSEDVNHSLWLPRIAGKKDVKPGRVVYGFGWLFEQTGSYAGECALYCGTSHASMKFNAHAVNAEQFEQWLNWGKGEMQFANASAKRGREYAYSCMACHTMNGMNTFKSRRTKFDAKKLIYNQELENYIQEKDQYIINSEKDGRKVFLRELESEPLFPHKPTAPILYSGDLVTIAPDLTDLKFRKIILAGLKENNKQNLVAWIKNPPSIKDEIENTQTIRMPKYENLYSNQVIEDIAEFLLTVKYSDTPDLVLNK